MPSEGPEAEPVFPPVLAEPAPPVLSDQEGVAGSLPAPPAFAEGRLHPLTLVFATWQGLRFFLIPLLAFAFFGGGGNPGGLMTVLVTLPLLSALIRYLTFTYRIENGELITRQGLLQRMERHIPLNRVQDIRVEQGILHRVFGMADVQLETAGGQGAEASISVLALAEAERFRSAILAAQSASAPARPELATGTAVGAPDPGAEVLAQLSLKEIIVTGLTSNHVTSALAVIFGAWAFLDELVPRFEEMVEGAGKSAEVWLHQGQHVWLAIPLLGLAVVGLGMAISVAGAVVVFYGFTLSLKGEDLQRSYGLLTRRASSLPRRRIQVLKIEETFLRRIFGFCTVRADTAGNPWSGRGQQGHGRDVLLPITVLAGLGQVLPRFFPEFESASWRQVSPRAIRRGTLKGSLVCVLFSVATLNWSGSLWGLWPLAFIPLVYVLQVINFRHLGFAFGSRFFHTRQGWLSRTTHIVPLRNIQSVVLRQTPFDRRHGVATLLVDTAGQQFTGGAPQIGNVPFEEGLGGARTLAHRAVVLRYKG